MEKWDHNTDIHRNDNGNDKRGGDGGDGVYDGKTNRRSLTSWS
jgi:hypothetical protein